MVVEYVVQRHYKKDFNNGFFIPNLGFLFIFFTFVTPKTPSVLYALVRQPADGESRKVESSPRIPERITNSSLAQLVRASDC